MKKTSVYKKINYFLHNQITQMKNHVFWIISNNFHYQSVVLIALKYLMQPVVNWLQNFYSFYSTFTTGPVPSSLAQSNLGVYVKRSKTVWPALKTHKKHYTLRLFLNPSGFDSEVICPWCGNWNKEMKTYIIITIKIWDENSRIIQIKRFGI